MSSDESEDTTLSALDRVHRKVRKEQKKKGLLTRTGSTSSSSSNSSDGKPKALDSTVLQLDSSPPDSDLSQEVVTIAPAPPAGRFAGLSYSSTPLSLASYSQRTIVPTPTQEQIDHDELAKALQMSTQTAQRNAGLFELPMPPCAMQPHHL